jgi:type I restriction enzyme, S subunit
VSFPRYSGYKDSEVEWLGEVPEHWDIRRVRRIFVIKKRIAGELGFDILSITQQGIKVRDPESNDGQVSMDYSKYQVVEPGDFAMNHMDLLTGYVDISRRLGVTSPDYRVFSIAEHCISDSGYLLYIFQMGYKQKILYAYGQGSSQLGRWRLPTEGFQEWAIPFPSHEEQGSISTFLDFETAKIDALIAEQQRLIGLLQEKRQAVISHAVTKGLNPNAPMKDSGVEWLGEVPEHWEVSQMRRYIQKDRKITYGIVQPGEPEPTGRFMVRGQDYSTGWSEPDSIFRVSPAIEEPYKRSRVKPGDLVMTIVGAGVGNTAKVPEWLDGANLTQTTCRIAVDAQAMNPDYMKLVLDSSIGRYSVGFYAKGAAQPGLNLEHVKVFPVTRPSLEEQITITEYLKEYLSSIDGLVKESQTASTLLHERRSALISAAVTGQIDVRGLALEVAA